MSLKFEQCTFRPDRPYSRPHSGTEVDLGTHIIHTHGCTQALLHKAKEWSSFTILQAIIK